MKEPIRPRFWKSTKFAKVAGLHPSTVLALVDQGEITAVQVGGSTLIPLDEVARILGEDVLETREHA